jgi:uncharacterized protein (DUF1499 family)
MKTFLKVYVVLFFGFISLNTFSQNAERFPAVRERILNAKFDEICRRMELEKSKAEQLRPVYRSFEREKGAFMLNNRAGEFAFPDSSLTEKQQDKFYLQSLEKAKKLVELRENYYPKFRTVLTPKQVVQFNRIEMEVNRRMMQQLRKRMNERNPGN